MRQRRDAALRSLKLMLVASVALPLLLFCYAAWANYHAAFALADERIERAGDIAAEQALRVFQSLGAGKAADDIPAGKREIVLVVEDDPDVRAYVVETLSALNYRVREAADGQAALRILDDSGAVDLLLTDVVMPGMNGRAPAEAAKLRRPGLKVLYMTGYSRNAIVHQGRLDAGVSLMQKPFSQNVLAMRVRTMLE
jgi:CheY-like chemotaxis protein